jgi:glycine/D-amino acid oxidase-like deaminating enzyme
MFAQSSRLRSDPLNLAGLARRRESAITTPTNVSSFRPDVAIIGAGVMGLGIAWRLAQAGCAVTVYEREEAGRGASWAAAGMLAAAAETEPGEEQLLALTLESQRMWPAFARELEAAAGLSIGYRDEGTIVVALTRDDAEQLRFTYEFQKRLGLDLEWLSAAEARRRGTTKSKTGSSCEPLPQRHKALAQCSASNTRSAKSRSSANALLAS